MSSDVTGDGEIMLYCDYPDCTESINIDYDPATGWVQNYPLGDIDYCPKHSIPPF